MSNPYQSPQFASLVAAGEVDREKIRRVARYQQWVLYALLVNIIFNVIAFTMGNQGQLVALAILAGALAVIAFAMVSIFLLANELLHPAVGVLCAILMIVPCVSLITLLIINGRATAYLQRHGVKVGFMGANPNSI